MEGRVSQKTLDEAVRTFGIAMTRENSERNALLAVRAQWEGELEPLIEAAQQALHQVDPQVTGPLSEKAVSPDRRKLWLDRLRAELKVHE